MGSSIRSVSRLRGREMTEIYLGLGSNLGDRAGHLKAAVRALEALEDSEVVAVSSIYRTAPVGDVDQEPFFNAVVRFRTSIEPQELLKIYLEIEQSRGRERIERWGPRTLDIDILLYGDRKVEEPGLILPHPLLGERAFALVPLLEVWPDARIGERSGRELLDGIGSEGVERLVRFDDCETVGIVGASSKSERYSNRAQRMLVDHGYSVAPISPLGNEILGVPGFRAITDFPDKVDTVTMYVGPGHQDSIVGSLIAACPKRVIFNPGTESAQTQERLLDAGIAVEEACTLVLLQSGQF